MGPLQINGVSNRESMGILFVDVFDVFRKMMPNWVEIYNIKG